jgi:hypothetical protein
MATPRRVLQAVLFTLTAIVGVIAATLIALQTPWARDSLRQLAERRAETALNADVAIGELTGTLLFGVTVNGLTIERDGTRVVAIEQVTADYDVFDFIQGQWELSRLVLVHPILRPGAFKLGGNRTRGSVSRPRFSIGEVIVRDGRVMIGDEPEEVSGFRVPDLIRDLDAGVSLRIGPEGAMLAIDRLSFVGQAPAVTLRQLSGTITMGEDDLVLDDIKVQLAESSFEFGGTIENFRSLGGA